MTLDVFQQVYALSFASSMVSDHKGTQTSLQEALQRELTPLLPIIGGWQLAWGPVVWKHEPGNADTGPDNSWFVAFHPGLQFEDGSVHPTYVIAIAGTPDESTYVWLEENFAVNSVSDFKAWVVGGIQYPPLTVASKDVVKGNAYIATGTVKTVHTLLTTPAPEGAISEHTTLLEFFANLDSCASPRFITTGHSLGGALSPAVALALVSAGYTPSNSTLTYPSAGPSPGDEGFTDLFTQTFPARKLRGASSYQGWNLNLVNTLDIVPQAWCVLRSISPEQNLGNIPPIYGAPVLALVVGTTIVFSLRALSSGVQYKPLPSQYFTGTPPSVAPTNLNEFLHFSGAQHVKAYLDAVGIPLPTLNKSIAFGVGLREKSKAEIAYNYPVISDFEWALEHPEEAHRIVNEAEGSTEGRALLRETAYEYV